MAHPCPYDHLVSRTHALDPTVLLLAAQVDGARW